MKITKRELERLIRNAFEAGSFAAEGAAAACGGRACFTCFTGNVGEAGMNERNLLLKILTRWAWSTGKLMLIVLGVAAGIAACTGLLAIPIGGMILAEQFSGEKWVGAIVGFTLIFLVFGALFAFDEDW